MRILYVTPYVPSLIRVRPYCLIRHLAALGHAVDLLALAPGDEADQVDAIRPFCRSTTLVPLPRRRVAANVAAGLVRGEPLQVAYGASGEVAGRLRSAVDTHAPDLVHVEHLRAARYGALLSGYPALFDAVDCISLLCERTAAASPQRLNRLIARFELAPTRRYEASVLDWFPRVVVTSEDDRCGLLSLRPDSNPEQISVLPNGVDLDYFRPLDGPRARDTVVFTGKMSYHANVAAALYLAREIMPHVWRRRPGVSLHIVGKDPPEVIRRLAAERRITVTGYVPDLRPHLGRATVAACPTPYGVGIQNKVLEAMAMGLPVITSQRACEALQAEPGVHLEVADSPGSYAGTILGLLENPGRGERLGVAARTYVEQFHNWLQITEDLVGAYARVLAESTTQRPAVVAPLWTG